MMVRRALDDQPGKQPKDYPHTCQCKDGGDCMAKQDMPGFIEHA
jgi:hypothetical protein